MGSIWMGIRSTLAVSLSIGVLAACQDRGQFAARTFSKEEVDAFNVKNSREARPATDPTKTPDAGGGTPTAAAPGTPSASSAAGPAPAPTAVPTTGQGPESNANQTGTQDTSLFVKDASSKNFFEPGVSVARETFIKKNLEDLANEKLKAPAIAIVEGISATVIGTAGKLPLTVEAQIHLGAEFYYLHIKDAPIEFTTDGSVKSFSEPGSNFVSINRTVNQEVVLNPESLVIASAACLAANCSQFILRLDFKVGSGSTPAIFLVSLTGGEFKITNSNLGDKLRDFKQAQEGPAPAPAPAPRAAGQQAAVPNAAQVSGGSGSEARRPPPVVTPAPATVPAPAPADPLVRAMDAGAGPAAATTPPVAAPMTPALTPGPSPTPSPSASIVRVGRTAPAASTAPLAPSEIAQKLAKANLNQITSVVAPQTPAPNTRPAANGTPFAPNTISNKLNAWNAGQMVGDLNRLAPPRVAQQAAAAPAPAAPMVVTPAPAAPAVEPSAAAREIEQMSQF